MKNRIYTLMALAVAVTCAYGQNMAIYKAQAKIDENKLKEAEEIITPALTNPKTTKLAEMYNLAGSIQIRFLQPELIKAAQQQPCDTALFVSSLEKAVQYYTKSNEYDMQPDKKGNVKPKFYEDNHKRLMAMLPYYNYAGIMLYNNGKKDEAADMFQKFIGMYQNPVFSKTEQDSIYNANKKEYDQASYNIASLAYSSKDWDKLLSIVDEALKSDNNLNDLYIMKSQACLAKGDTAKWVSTMEEAVERVESSTSFAQNLLYYYIQKNDAQDALSQANSMIEKNPNSKNGYYMKGCVLLNLQKDFPASRECFEKAIALDDQFVESYINIGVSYINEVISRRNKGEYCTDRTKVKQYNADIEKMKVFYKNALPYFEKARELRPDDIKLWAANLQNVYSNLGMKDKANEMDQLLQQAANQK